MADVWERVLTRDDLWVGLPPARSFPFPATTAGLVQVIAGAGLYMGHCVEETTGAAVARCVVGDGDAVALGRTFGPLTLSAGQSRCDYWPQPGLVFQTGLAVQVTAGTVAGALWLIELTRDQQDMIRLFRTGNWR